MGKIIDELDKILDESVWGSFWLPKVWSYADSLKKKNKKSVSWKAVSSDLKAPDSMRDIMKSEFGKADISITETEENLDEGVREDLIDDMIKDLKEKKKNTISWKDVSIELKLTASSGSPTRDAIKNIFKKRGITITESEENLDESAMGDLLISIQELIQDLKKAKKDSITWKEASEAIIKSGIRIAKPNDPEFKKMVTRELNKKKITVK
jgi:hypothetical protein